VALISQHLWQRRFASDPQILGKKITLDGEPHTVIGIVAEAPMLREIGFTSQVYVPLQIDPNTHDQASYLGVLARLKPGITLKQARSQFEASTAEYRAKFPGVLEPQESFTAKPYREEMVGGDRRLLLVLSCAVGLVLLIACANVANLLLVRAAGRQREIAIRTALGAGRGRMIRQLLTECVLLFFAGGTTGLFLGYGGMRVLLAVNTADLSLVGTGGANVSMDWRVMAFALLISLATGVVFGWFPALAGSRADLNSVLKDSGGRSGTGVRQNKARASLVLSEVGLALVLLIGAALLIRSFAALYSVNLGFDTKNIVTMNIALTGPKYSKSAAVANTVRAGLARVRSLPGVVSAGATCCLPLAQGTYDLGFDIVGRQAGSSKGAVGWTAVSSGYFDVFKIPLKQGRTFNAADDNKSPAVVVIDESMAKKYWKNENPLGQQIVMGAGLEMFKSEPVRQIVGIVGDIRSEGLGAKPRPIMYVPQAQVPDAANATFQRLLPVAWLVRTQGPSHALIPAIQEQLRQATGLPVTDVSTMDQVVWAQTGRQRFNALLMSIFGSTALLLAAIGIYGLMAYSVEQRRQEIGIRMALGAESHDVRNMVVRQGMQLALAGIVVGLAVAWALSRSLESQLYGVKARDPLVFIAAAIVLIAVALASVWLPAARASRVNPIDSLRCQ